MPASEKQLPDAATADDAASSSRYALRFPRPSGAMDQDEEWCEVFIDDHWERIRFHDYHDIYVQPGLYEALFARNGAMRCVSPVRVVDLLHRVIREAGDDPRTLAVLDLGAGNGMVGEQLRRIGARKVVGADLIPEARDAALRDRPGVYDDYIVADFAELTPEQKHTLASHRCNALTTVSALGFGDIPTRAFATAYAAVADNGWIAINVNEEFLRGGAGSAFSRLIWSMMASGALHVHAFERYCHRLSVKKEKLYYVAIIGRKIGEIPDELLAGRAGG